jgi:hypothetical protein
MVERQLSNDQIDLELAKVQFNNENFAKQFHHQTQQTWFREYGKGSKNMLKKITAKVKHGIKHNKYGESGLNTLDEGWKQFLKPKYKPQAQQSFNNTKEQTQLINDQKEGSNKNQRRKGRENEIMQARAPSGRVYSYTEAHEGITSKRAKEWRKKHDIDESDI